MRTVYLAGPIAGLSHEEASQWRNKAAEMLIDRGCKVIDPLLKYKAGNFSGMPDYAWTFYEDVEKGVMEADVVLAGFPGGEVASLGTGFELGVAYAMGIPVEAWTDGKEIEHPFLKVVAAWHKFLDSACNAAAGQIGWHPSWCFETHMGEVFHRMRQVLLDRRRKYGTRNIDESGVHGLITRMGDKLARIREDHRGCPFLGECKGRKLPDEQMLDAWIDLAIYAGPIGLMLLRRVWWTPMFAESKLKKPL
jgi:nucleoside 2-deoxyribosyltransferase